MKKNRGTKIAPYKTGAEKNRTVEIAHKTHAELLRENPTREGDDELLTGNQACTILHISSKALKRLRDKKEIGCVIVTAGTYRYKRKAHIEAFIKRREKPAR